MTWNWQLPQWPHFSYDDTPLKHHEECFLLSAGLGFGAFAHLNHAEQTQLRVDLLSEEALHTSAIEGEHLNRESVQSSIRRALGLSIHKRHITPAEQGIAEMMIDTYQNFAEPLDDHTLFKWHVQLMQGHSDIEKGCYRTHPDPMLIVSGKYHDPTIHFEAPPSTQVQQLMQQFITWFNTTAPNEKNALSALTRSGIAHLYFESIHPFEDGNGRIGRAIAEKAIAQCLGKPNIASLSYQIEKNKKAYYAALGQASRTLLITDWLIYFSEIILRGQEHTGKQIEFLINKTKFFDKYQSQLNERQKKVLSRMFAAGSEGFKGGLSAENYINITKTSRATATRDLHALVSMGALQKQGELRYARYALILP